jgi:hypothetical protein
MDIPLMAFEDVLNDGVHVFRGHLAARAGSSEDGLGGALLDRLSVGTLDEKVDKVKLSKRRGVSKREGDSRLICVCLPGPSR